MHGLRTISTLFFTVTLIAADKPVTQPSAAEKWAKHYDDRVALFEKENAAAKSIVMVGSSHIERFDASKYLHGRRVVNRGIASDRIGVDGRGVLGRLDNSVFDCNPGIILLENGVNDLGELWRNGTPSMDEIEACYRKVVAQIRMRLPRTQLVIIGLFPTSGRYAGLKPLVLDFNARLRKIAVDYKCPFMDVYKPFADSEGLLRKDCTADGLHLNEAGYRVWAELIQRILSVEAGATTRP